MSKNRTGARWWIFAASSALLITALVAAVVYLITKKPSIVDQVVILTVPSGAEIKIDSKSYGNSPVKLEQVKVGTYTLTISKENYETISEQVEISDTMPLEYNLKRVTPPDAVGLSTEDRLRQYQQNAEEALANNRLVWPRDNSAYNYVELILSDDPANLFALETKETIRKRLLQTAQAATSRGDLGEAKETITSLLEFYPRDPESLAVANRLEAHLATRRGEVRDWTRKADDAFRAGNLIEPARASAYYYSGQALAIEPQNAQAVATRNRIKDQLVKLAEQAQERGDSEAAIKQLQQAAKFFDDKQIRAKISEIRTLKEAETVKAGDPELRRRQGLDKYRSGDFSDAIHDLEFASTNGKATPDVIFALGHSHFQLSHWGEAATYFHQVPRLGDAQYISARALLGEIAARRGDMNKALEFYKEARQLGGSNLYMPARLDDLIERIEKRQQEKAAAPTPVAITVKHPHGALRGSCSGALSVDSGGVRYDGEHPLSANLVGVNAVVRKNELVLGFQGKSVKFEVSTAEADRFRDALVKYQAAAAQK